MKTENIKVQIRRCCPDDFDEIILLLRQLWENKIVDPSMLRPIFDRSLSSPSKVYLCGTLESRVVAFGSLTVKENLWPEGHVGYIDELVVDSAHRGDGAGAAILNQLVSTARDLNCCKVELDCALFRTEAHQFYGQNGFSKRCYVFCKEF